jgi:2-C-methyl-D-erythritol 2,4-cyclodiphosphate synthase
MKPRVRVGIGFDFHPLREGRELRLGGVSIPHEKGLDGYSDADALCHAVADALLGGAGLADIGAHFPDDDPRNQGLSGLVLLQRVHELVQAVELEVGNVDIVVIAEEPRIGPHKDAIRANLARVLQLAPGEVGIKATTMEGKGVIGRKEGISVEAVALLYRDTENSRP